MNYKKISILAFLMCTLTSWGHQDDSGDVHPDVRVEGNRFTIYFRNNREEQSYKTILEKDGSVISKRKKSTEAPKLKLPLPLPENLQGINIQTEEAFYVFPEWERKHKGKPFFLKIIRDKTEKVYLDWDKTHIDEVHGAGITKEEVVITTSATRPKDDKKGWPFTFNSFDRKTHKRLHSSDIGVPTRVYSFPRDSNVAIYEGYAYVAWMGRNGDELALKLSRFDPSSGLVETRRISRGWGNSSPSIGLIDENLLIAFHRREIRIKDDKHTYQAEIVYKRVQIHELFKKNKK